MQQRWEDMVVVGRVARPHGLHGQVIVNPETDFVEDRFAVGATMWTRGGGDALTIASVRIQGGRPVVAFEGLSRIEDAAPLAGLELRVPEETLQPLQAGSYYHHQLVGCFVEDVNGQAIGEVERVEGGAGSSRLAINGRRGEILIPLAAEICVEIDVERRRIRIDPPEGLIDLNASTDRSRGRPSGRPGT
jgi:16S rRNA processing protein RimM